MSEKTISALANQIRGVSYNKRDLHDKLDENSIILLRANNIVEGKLNFRDVVYVDKSVVAADQYLKDGDILISASSGSKKMIGKAASFHSKYKCTFGAFCKVVRPHDDIKEFLSIYFQSAAYRREISHLALGANINNIRNEHINSLQVQVPDYVTRLQMIKVINKLQKIRDVKKQKLKKLDELIKARFVEMFGDIKANDKLWPTESFNSLFEVTSSKRILKSNWQSSGNIPFLRVRDMVCLSEGKELNNEFYISEKLYDSLSDIDGVPAPGDILISATSTLGKCHIVLENEKFYFKDADILRFRPRKEINATYFVEAMENFYIRDQINRTLGITTVKHLTIKATKSLFMRVPPISLQNEFANFIHQVDKSKVAVQKSLDETQKLYDSLMQEYFG